MRKISDNGRPVILKNAPENLIWIWKNKFWEKNIKKKIVLEKIMEIYESCEIKKKKLSTWIEHSICFEVIKVARRGLQKTDIWSFFFFEAGRFLKWNF